VLIAFFNFSFLLRMQPYRLSEKYQLSISQNILKIALYFAGAALRVCAFSFDIGVTTVSVLLLWVVTDLSDIKIFGIVFVVSWVYTAALESSSRQGTLGKMAMGIY
jgi:uncharacterized RDD family membrane protein YckC